MRNPISLPGADDACPLCGYWRCRCATTFAPPLHVTPTDSDPDMDEALRRVRAGGAR
ncbi:hypothetical protein F0L17_14585 [Streptomyces sp. TRM43335]|uniref:Uncharacterized protein n=1 Tax=Streptomyces taklimakanensis TaxID=2569853 RepID=A0A6G2BEI1_9ACTN|nr:hypothetical protein [Streptomyces taklimakanensis]MTE20312.1 hypothetical protein [Streptomyces taklimakanensis]